MRVRLMHPEQAFDAGAVEPPHADDLVRDLELGPIIEAMGAGDAIVGAVARRALLTGTGNPLTTIEHRQSVLADARRHPALIRGLYDGACEALAAAHQARFGLKARLASVVLRHAIEQLTVFVDRLGSLRDTLIPHEPVLASEGLSGLAAMLRGSLTDEALAAMARHLRDLKGQRAVLVSARLGAGNKPVGYRLHQPTGRDRSRFKRWWPAGSARYRFEPGDDERERQALRQLREERLTLLSESLRRSAEATEAFLTQLRDELAFYVGCLNLERRLGELGVSVTLPSVAAADDHAWQLTGVSDAALALTSGRRVVPNDLHADACRTVVVTGANQGGKSTYLRSLGQAQLMAQAGMPVAADEARLSCRDAVLTHFPRPEDRRLRQGKLDEELARLSQCIDTLTPHALFLSNESCAVTNQREGARILGDVAAAVHEHGARAVYVTHLHELATAVRDWATPAAVLLRAERGTDGERSFRIVRGEPEATSHGADLYDRIIGPDEGASSGHPA